MKTSTTISEFQRAALKFGGFDISNAEESSQKTVNILTQYSLLLLIPVVVAAFSSAYAAYTMTNNALVAVFVGLIWSGIIYLIDRSILSTSGSTSFSGKTVFRILLSITLSTLFAEPIVLMVFNDSIQEAQYRELMENKKPLDIAYSQELALLNQKEQEASKRLIVMQRAYTVEMDGTGGSGVRNQGPIFKQKYADYQVAKEEHAIFIKNIEDSRKKLEDKYRDKISSVRAAQAKSLAGQIDTLHAIDSGAIQVGVWVLRFALIFLELMPVLVKLTRSSSWDNYWEIVDQNNLEKLSVHKNNSEFRTAALNKESKIRHERRMKQLDKESVQVDIDHQGDVLNMQIDEIMKAGIDKININAKALEKFKNDEKLRNQLMKEINIAYLAYRNRIASIMNQ